MSFHVTCMHTEQLGWVTSLCLPQLLNSWINAYVWNRAGLMSNHSLRSSSKNCSSLKEELIPWRHWSLASYSERVSSCVVMSKSGQEAEGRKDCQSGNPKQKELWQAHETGISSAKENRVTIYYFSLHTLLDEHDWFECWGGCLLLSRTKSVLLSW